MLSSLQALQQVGFISDADIGVRDVENGEDDAYSIGKVASTVRNFNFYTQQAIDTMANSKAPTPSCEKAIIVYQKTGKAISSQATALTKIACAPTLPDNVRSEIASGAEKAPRLYARVGTLLAEHCPARVSAITAGGLYVEQAFAPIAEAFSESCDRIGILGIL
uniref:Uncharacterized protein n=1 Tax=Ramularia collo-cygni TaxID=112498 RepID=A0A2D3V8B6_9PEZI